MKRTPHSWHTNTPENPEKRDWELQNTIEE